MVLDRRSYSERKDGEHSIPNENPMKNTLRSLLVLVLAVGSLAHAADEPAKKKGPASQADRILKQHEAAGLTDDQVAKIKEHATVADGKIAALRKQAALTADQRTAQKEATQKAKDAGKTGKEAREMVSAAVTLTAEQEAAKKETQTITQELNKAVTALLTDEQKAKLKEARGAGKKKPAAATS